MSAGHGSIRDMSTPPGSAVRALVARFGANVATLSVWPMEAIDLAVAAANRAGFDFTATHDGTYGTALYWQPEDFDDHFLGTIADALSRHGVGAYAYRLNHADTDEQHVDVFVRLGERFPRVGGRVVFVQVREYAAGDEHTGPSTVVLGAPDDLAELLPMLQVRFMPEPSYTPDGGMASIVILHEDVTGGILEADEVIDDLRSLIVGAGFEGPVTYQRCID